MKYFSPLFVAVFAAGIFLNFSSRTLAASPTPSATNSGEASISATPTATVSAQVSPQPKAEEKADKDLTNSSGTSKGALAQYLDEKPAQPLNPSNAIQHAIRNAVNKGVPANLLVLLLLFPVVASLVAVFRHVIGLSGFGVYAPAALAVAFVSTGFAMGMILFAIIFVATWLGKIFVTKFKLQYLPRTALLLWVVSLIMFAILLATPYVGLTSISLVGFFPILILVLLSENFMEAQMTGNILTAVRLTMETLVLAVMSAFVMRTLEVQKFVILNPELTILGVFFLNLVIGKYTGLRVLEYFRFKQVLETQEE